MLHLLFWWGRPLSSWVRHVESDASNKADGDRFFHDGFLFRWFVKRIQSGRVRV